MNYKNTAEEILRIVGGEDNVNNVTHCITRLRFNLKDSHVDMDAIKSVKGVVGGVTQGGQVQVIIGNDVSKVFTELMKLGSFKKDGVTEGMKENKKLIPGMLDFIAGCFTPILPVIIGAGMLKAVLSILVLASLISDQEDTYYLLSTIADAGFYFIPILLAYTASTKLSANPFMAMMMAFILVHPNIVSLFAQGENSSFLGIPVIAVTYSSSVIPILLIVYFMSYVEKFAEKVSPNSVKIFLKPLLIILITAPLGLIVIGPLGTIIGDFMALIIQFINNRFGWLSVGIVGALYPWMVMTGMHYSVGPVMAPAYTKYGFDALLMPAALAANMGQAGAALGVAFKSKDKEMRDLAKSTGFTALLGVTEPAMYGVNLKLKKPMIAVTIAGGIAGIYAGLTGVKAFVLGLSPGISGLPMYVGDYTFIHAIITMLIAVVVSFVVTIMIGFDEVTPVQSIEKKEVQSTPILSSEKHIDSPLSGHLMPLNLVSDDTFAQEIMGKGVAIVPVKGKVFAPFDGKVEVVAQTKHAIGLSSNDGIEVLIHVGIDTVRLNGEYFTSYVQQGQIIKKGDLLLEFDIEAITIQGYEIVTPIIVLNTPEFLDVIAKESGYAECQEKIITLL